MLCSHYDLKGAVFSAKEQGKESSPFPKSIFFRLLEAVAHILKCSFPSEKHTVKAALRGSMFIVFLCFPAKCAQFYKLKCFTSLPALKIQPLKCSQILSSICTITNSTRLKAKSYPWSHNRNPCPRVIPPALIGDRSICNSTEQINLAEIEQLMVNSITIVSCEFADRSDATGALVPGSHLNF